MYFKKYKGDTCSPEYDDVVVPIIHLEREVF